MIQAFAITHKTCLGKLCDDRYSRLLWIHGPKFLVTDLSGHENMDEFYIPDNFGAVRVRDKHGDGGTKAKD